MGPTRYGYNWTASKNALFRNRKDSDSLQTLTQNWIEQNFVRLIISVLVVLAYFALNWLIARLTKRVSNREFKREAANRVIKSSRFITAFFGILALLIVWGIHFGTVAIFATTTVTLLGVALFASWSLLSNITSYFVLLFHPSFSRGAYIRVFEADNFVEGFISDLTLFCIELKTLDDEIIAYPNNLLLSRVVVVNPKKRSASVGKIVNPATETECSHPPDNSKA